MALSAPLVLAVLAVAAALVVFALRRARKAPACAANADCAPGQVCKGGACASCAADADCSTSGASCLSGACTTYAADAGVGVGGCAPAAASPYCGASDPLWGGTNPSVPCTALKAASPGDVRTLSGGWCGLNSVAAAQAACSATPSCAGYFTTGGPSTDAIIPSAASLAVAKSISIGDGAFKNGTHWAKTLVN